MLLGGPGCRRMQTVAGGGHSDGGVVQAMAGVNSTATARPQGGQCRPSSTEGAEASPGRLPWAARVNFPTRGSSSSTTAHSQADRSVTTPHRPPPRSPNRQAYGGGVTAA